MTPSNLASALLWQCCRRAAAGPVRPLAGGEIVFRSGRPARHFADDDPTLRGSLFALARTILTTADINVSCVNGTPGSRGGVLIDLDDPKGGSFVLGAQRP